MKNHIYFACLLAMCSCRESDENFPIEPTISFVDVKYGQGERMVLPDTLTITFNFTDGDSDLGFVRSDTLFPFHPWIFFRKNSGEQIPSDKLFNGEVGLEELIRLSDKQTPPFDTLPEAVDWCRDDITLLYSDPPYHLPNANYYNIFVDFFYEDLSGAFVEYDWYEEYCVIFNGRFGAIAGQDGPYLLKMTNDKKGQLTYRMLSAGFQMLFAEKKMKLRIYIKDRALHNSNVIETPPFFLKDV